MATELITIKGETDGTVTTGDFPLVSELFYTQTGPPAISYPTKIVLPVGTKAKVWFKEVSGAPVDVSLYIAKDAAAISPTWVLLERISLPSSGTISIEKRRPHLIRSITGTEGFKLSWTQATAGKSFITIGLEITDED